MLWLLTNLGNKGGTNSFVAMYTCLASDLYQSGLVILVSSIVGVVITPYLLFEIYVLMPRQKRITKKRTEQNSNKEVL